MKLSIVVKALLFIPFFAGLLWVWHCYKDWRYSRSNASLQEQVGKTFVWQHVIDSNGKLVQPDFTTTDFTVIDFWFKNCPWCIEEMQQFEAVLKTAGNKFSIISISVDDTLAWKKVLRGQQQRLAFLAKPVPGWQHVVLSLPDGRSAGDYVQEQYGVSSYPAALVVNREGKIIAAPASAVTYIRKTLGGRSAYWAFVFNKATWCSIKTWLLLLLSALLYMRLLRLLPAVQ
ncbi:MAG TPA: TlpA disulfide reductase family protein [Ferruginibacter sp.]|nr:TlpA disulfide reductase family protein [Ferruginibacter sp.]HMP21526.1 TlpA disulfide reductase family protein [Ferruginibacter sp.]